MKFPGLILVFALAGCVPPKGPPAAATATAPAAPAGRAVGRSHWNTLAPGARVKAVTKKGTYVGGFILYHDGVLWLATDGDGRKALDALEVVRLYVNEAQ